MTTKDGQREWITLKEHCTEVFDLFMPNDSFVKQAIKTGYHLEDIKIDSESSQQILSYLFIMKFAAAESYVDAMQSLFYDNLQGELHFSGSDDNAS